MKKQLCLHRISELPAHMECDGAAEAAETLGAKVKKAVWFFLRHLIYACMLLEVILTQADKRLAPHLLFTWRQLLRSKKVALWFYFGLSVVMGAVGRRLLSPSDS